MLREQAPAAGRTLADVLTAQQVNLVRAVLSRDASYLNHPHMTHPVTGGRAVRPIETGEIEAFATAWGSSPVTCVRTMNESIARLSDVRRPRYMKAAVALEIEMDRRGSGAPGDDLVGIPEFIPEGYTDLGLTPRKLGRAAIIVDKTRLFERLVAFRVHAVSAVGVSASSDELRIRVQGIAQALRESLGYIEDELESSSSGGTVLLSDCVERQMLGGRHLAILMQLALQEHGVCSRLVKGVLKLYGLKGRHAWNIVSEGDSLALVDVTFAEDSGPLVLSGASLEEIYARASEIQRGYAPYPDNSYHYRLRPAG